MANYAIDYTSRDYESLKSDLINLIKSRLGAYGKSWSATDPSDFGVVLVEAFAYVGDITNYYIDRVANETYLPTAVQRSSVLKLAKAMNYTPNGFLQARVVLTVTNGLDQEITIPEGTQLSVIVPITSSSSVKLLFTTSIENIISASSDGTTDIEVVHGENISLRAVNRATSETELDGEYLTLSSNGYADQMYDLAVENPVDSTIAVFVEDSGTYVEWSRAQHLYDHGPNDNVYEVIINEDNSATIKFGNGVTGAIPSVGAEIKAQYMSVSGGGAVGNVPAGLTSWVITDVPSYTVDKADLTPLSFYNSTPGSGGSDPESNASIRENAPKALSANNRAITLSDFSVLALSVNGVGPNKAVAYATNPTSVVMYVAPQNTTGATSFYPGFDDNNTAPTPQLVNLTQSVESFLSTRTQIGTTVTVLPPIYVPVNVVLQYKRLVGSTHKATQTALSKAFFASYGYDNMVFDGNIFPENIESDLSQVGTNVVKVTSLYRQGDSRAREVFKPAMGELPVFSDLVFSGGSTKGLEIYPWASLRYLTISSGTLTPVFDALVTEYTVTDVATSTVTFTYESVDPADTVAIKVNGSPLVGTTVTTPTSATTVVSVTVTSADLTASTSYVVNIIRA